MKKFVLLVGLLICMSAYDAKAQAVSYIDEMKALGMVAGQGLACGASKYETYEMLARAILVTKALSDREQEAGMRAYSEEKANTYMSKQFDGFFECDEINRRFDRQEIFKLTLYGDGTIKMPDGEIFTPRTPYDATLLYDGAVDDRVKAQELYSRAANPVPESVPEATVGHISRSKK